MITKNGMLFLIRTALFLRGPTSVNTQIPLTDITNELCYVNKSTTTFEGTYTHRIIGYDDYNLDLTVSSSYAGGFLIWIGTGATSLTLDFTNYNLGSPINKADIAVGNAYLLHPASGGTIIGCTFTNLTNQPIDVNEIGLFGKSYYFRTISSSVSGRPILFARNIIDTITIAPTESKEFTFELSVY